MASYTVVYLDLEATGVSLFHEIIQIGATTSMNYKFSKYIMPRVAIEPGATEKHGMTTYNGQLYKRNVPVPTVSLEEACRQLLTFLSNFMTHVILVAHNGSNFDFPLLVRDMQRVGLLQQLRAVVAGAVDSIPVFRNKLPHWGANDFGLATMASSFGVPAHNAHDALRDAEILETLCRKLNVTINDLWAFAQLL